VSEARLLLVDDDPGHLELLSERLAAEGFEIERARSGLEALTRLDAEWPDLVILDLMMPHMDGQTVASRIKARADIPILVLSADATAGSKTELIDHFAEDYVTKPYDYTELIARIRRVLRRVSDQLPVQEVDLGDLVIVPRRREAIVRGRPVSLRIPLPRDARGGHAQLGGDRTAAAAGLGGLRSGRSRLRLGDGPAPPPEGRGRPQPAAPSPDRSGGRVSTGGLGAARLDGVRAVRISYPSGVAISCYPIRRRTARLLE
jgi:two-component system chemotaxis response regulator CheY